MSEILDKREAIRAIAVYLDVTRPGWADEIDLPSFNMSHGDHCLGGQLFGDSDTTDNQGRCGWQQLAALTSDALPTLGHALATEALCGGTDVAWREEIHGRRTDKEAIPFGVIVSKSGSSVLLDSDSDGSYALQVNRLKVGDIEITDGTDSLVLSGRVLCEAIGDYDGS